MYISLRMNGAHLDLMAFYPSFVNAHVHEMAFYPSFVNADVQEMPLD